jgi:hypothetical protein
MRNLRSRSHRRRLGAFTLAATFAAAAVLFPQGGRFALALLPYFLLLAGPLLALLPRPERERRARSARPRSHVG